jgi:hypothetical protein
MNWMSILYPGLKVRKKEWIISGLVYLAIVVLFFAFIPGKEFPTDSTGHKIYTIKENLVFAIFFLGWAASVGQAFLIRRQYLILLSEQIGGIQNRVIIDQTQFVSDQKSQQQLEKLYQLKREIMKKIDDDQSTSIIRDLKPLVETYVENAKELIERKKKLERIVTAQSIKQIEATIAELKVKNAKTENDLLRKEYQEAIEKYTKHRKAVQEMIDQQEMVKLRLSSTEMSLEQIKYDLIKMENLTSDEQKKELFKSVEEKSIELSEYLDVLKDTYDGSDSNI